MLYIVSHVEGLFGVLGEADARVFEVIRLIHSPLEVSRTFLYHDSGLLRVDEAFQRFELLIEEDAEGCAIDQHSLDGRILLLELQPGEIRAVLTQFRFRLDGAFFVVFVFQR